MKRLEHIVDLLLEPGGEHFVCLVENECAKARDPQHALLYHIEHPARGPDDDVLACTEGLCIFATGGATNARVATDAHVVAQRNGDLIDLQGQLARRRQHKCLGGNFAEVHASQRSNHEGCSLPSARLRLADGVTAIDDRPDCALLDRAGPLESVGVDASQEAIREIHVVEGIVDRILVDTRQGNVFLLARHRRHRGERCW
mmetsp:Transcript_92118/g.256646  ORF Transcript_92118/g.256646 Transcript_92118/m.256646 type:complete len:201 (-) Transcript_92118:74-676(-)